MISGLVSGTARRKHMGFDMLLMGKLQLCPDILLFIYPKSWGCKIISIAMSFRRSISLIIMRNTTHAASSKRLGILRPAARMRDTTIMDHHGYLASQRNGGPMSDHTLVHSNDIPKPSTKKGSWYVFPHLFPIAGWLFRHLCRWKKWHIVICDHLIIWSTWNQRMMGLGNISTPQYLLKGHEQSRLISAGEWIFLQHQSPYSQVQNETRKFAGLSWSVYRLLVIFQGTLIL